MASKDVDLYRAELEKARNAGKPTLSPRKKVPAKSLPSKTKRAKAGGREYLVQDREMFAAILDEAIKVRYAGIRDAAATANGIGHNTLGRYHKKTGHALRHDTLQKLRKLVGRSRVNALESALTSPQARKALQEYDTWVSTQIRSIALGDRRSTSDRRDNKEAFDLPFGRDSYPSISWQRAQRMMKLIERSRRRFPGAWNPLSSRLKRSPHFSARARLAELRVVSPLFDWEDTSGIERSGGELTDKELERFLKAGATREAILLDREIDIRRAQDEPRGVSSPDINPYFSRQPNRGQR